MGRISKEERGVRRRSLPTDMGSSSAVHSLDLQTTMEEEKKREEKRREERKSEGKENDVKEGEEREGGDTKAEKGCVDQGVS